MKVVVQDNIKILKYFSENVSDESSSIGQH